jgi:hypothetical protein
VPGLTATAAGSAWSYGGSILTFVFPMLLFLIVAAVLWVLFTKPQVVPGHRDRTIMRSVGSTWLVRPVSETGPAEGGQAPASGGAQASSAEGGQAAVAEGGQPPTEGEQAVTAEGEGR